MDNCNYNGCTNTRWAKGLCGTHYTQQREGRPLTPVGSNYMGRERLTHGSLYWYNTKGCRCDDCKGARRTYNQERLKNQKRNGLPENKEHGTNAGYRAGCRCELCREAKRHYSREQKYAVSKADYTALHTAQEGKCACCGKPKPLVVDHMHGTSHVRGLLCHGCNTGIGKLGDDIEGVQRALDYLTSTLPKD